jgi:hypothetical protein
MTVQQKGRHTAPDGSTFTVESLQRALDSHKAAGLIRDWVPRPLEPVKGRPASRYWLWKVTLADGREHQVCTIWELLSLVTGLASARHAYAATGARRPLAKAAGHRHEFQGQALVHAHDDGPHGYYGHPEDRP